MQSICSPGYVRIPPATVSLTKVHFVVFQNLSYIYFIYICYNTYNFLLLYFAYYINMTKITIHAFIYVCIHIHICMYFIYTYKILHFLWNN